MINFMTSS